MNDLATINRIYKWADQNRIKYQDKYQMDGSPSALKTFERYDDICDICRAAEIGKAEEDKVKKHIHKNQMAMIDKLHELEKFSPENKFDYDDVEMWMRKMMV